MPFSFRRLEIPDLVLVTAQRFCDERGWFAETHRRSVLAAEGIPEFVQDNRSWSRQGVLRGMHYQVPPAAQGKLVSVAVGEIYDVAVDVRLSSPTFGRWVGCELSAETLTMLYVPPGFAHGFCVLSSTALVAYKLTAEYAPEDERGIRWDDSDLGISWPIQNPYVSERDRDLPTLRDARPDLPVDGWQ